MKSPCKTLVLFVVFGFSAVSMFGQNSFPATGNVSIGNTSAGTLLDIGNGIIPAEVPSGSNVGALQVRTTSSAANINIASSFFTDQKVANNSSVTASQFYTYASHPSGNVSLMMPIIAVSNHSNAGTVGDMRMFTSVCSSSGSGNVNNMYTMLGIMSNGGTGTVNNAYGFYLNAIGGNVLHKWGIYINDATAGNYMGGTLAIGTTDNKGYALAVNGSAVFTKAVVKPNASWPDYVFKAGYRLPSLDSLAAYVRTNRHLPELPTAEEVQDKGVDLGNNQVLLLKKIEELTLYVMQQNEQLKAQQEEIAILKKKMKK